MRQADVHVDVPQSGSGKQRKMPMMAISPNLLQPAKCLSAAGIKTGQTRGGNAQADKRVHTSLLSMLVANQLTEQMLEQLMGATARLPAAQAHGVSGTVAGVVRSTPTSMIRSVSERQVAMREETGAARNVRAKHLSPYLQKKYQAGNSDSIYRPTEVKVSVPVFREVQPIMPTHTASVVNNLSSMNIGKAALVVEAVNMAKKTLAAEKGRAAAARAAASKARKHRARRPSKGGDTGSSHGTSSFRAPKRDASAHVGYNVERTGMGTEATQGPAHYHPRWDAQRPHSAVASVKAQYSCAGRHYEHIMAHKARLKAAAEQLTEAERQAARASTECRARPSSPDGAGPADDTVAAEDPANAVTRVNATPARFVHERPCNSAPFKASERSRVAGYTILTKRTGCTSAELGPGSYEALPLDVTHQRSPRPVSSLSVQTPRPAVIRVTGAPQAIGPGAYDDTKGVQWSAHQKQARASDFARGSVRPGSAPPPGMFSRGYIPPAVVELEQRAFMSRFKQPASTEPAAAAAAAPGTSVAAASAVADDSKPGPLTAIHDDDFICEDDTEDGAWGCLDSVKTMADAQHVLSGSGMSRQRPRSGRPTSARPISGLPKSAHRPPSARRSASAASAADEQARPPPGTVLEDVDEAGVLLYEDDEVSSTRPVSGRPVSAKALSSSIRSAVAAGGRPLSPRHVGQKEAVEEAKEARLEPAVAAAGMQQDYAHVKAWNALGSSPWVVDRPSSAFSNPDMAAESYRVDLEIARSRPASAAAALGRARGTSAADPCTTADARRMASAHKSGSDWARPVRQPATRRPDSMLTPGPGEYEHVRSARALKAAVRGGSMPKATRTQELGASRMMSDGRVVKPVTAPRQDTADLMYSPNYEAASHRTRSRGVQLPQNRGAVKRWLTEAALDDNMIA